MWEKFHPISALIRPIKRSKSIYLEVPEKIYPGINTVKRTDNQLKKCQEKLKKAPQNSLQFISCKERTFWVFSLSMAKYRKKVLPKMSKTADPSETLGIGALGLPSICRCKERARVSCVHSLTFQ